MNLFMTQILLAEDLENGSLGLSTGLEYDPGIYSNTEEVIALARIASAQGGRYISHMRSELAWGLGHSDSVRPGQKGLISSPERS